ncbi:glycosyltransferase family 2 protein [Psychroserpens sp.]|uniref:glycosyltransferase family 2 protein n=1 Tax=Psychroserpens sp. TaxID=2020870 RepID=UPI003C7844EA
MSNKPTISEPTKIELLTIHLMILVGCFSIVNFLYWFLQPEYRLYPLLYWLLCLTLFYGILRTLYIWYYYWNISIPKIQSSEKTFTVDILTTFFPGEPYEMILTTLHAIQRISYPHTTYLCDESNDPYLKQICKSIGVIHVTRDNRIGAKAGNINNALKIAKGEICVVLDPDHVPSPDFLDPIMPFFSDAEIGFVQVVQSYYNTDDTLVARGAAEQTYQFYGPMMMTMNSYGTVNAIGANCTFRRKALNSIGGHAAGLAEDMHTAMLLHSKGWKSVYIPKVLAKGLVPSSLTAFFKQQLKWARGTFDLLFFVYPKLFTRFTLRQKIHYGLLPLHYFIGVLYLVNFLIPILSLFLYKMPWSGNILYFGFIIMPIIMSNFLLRVYIQKWVIEKKERGFHVIGGLLQITSWWYYFLGFVYTILRKKIPYIPTPKQGENSSNYKIIIPNLVIAVLSIAAIIYGLHKNLTPFSIIMSGFAALNAGFMIFSIYLSNQETNRNQILREKLHQTTVTFFVSLKGYYRQLSNYLFHLIRPIALSLLLIILSLSIFAQVDYTKSQWEDVSESVIERTPLRYLGIFYPAEDNGLSNLKQIAKLENKENIKFDIVSLYVAWGDKEHIAINDELISGIYKKNAIPLISWEPWASDFSMNDSLPESNKEDYILKHIAHGKYDNYIKSYARYLKSYEKPVFLRFAHEFDNPFYPWSETGLNSPLHFKEAWVHIYKMFKDCGAGNVFWIWNPWKVENMNNYFPGDAYVDWVGITGLNYGLVNEENQLYSFESLYSPFHDALKSVTDKPVMIAEFGSLNADGHQEEWIEKGLRSIDQKFKDVNAVVLFNSNLDNNIPNTLKETSNKLNWTLNSYRPFRLNFAQDLPEYVFNTSLKQKGAKIDDTRKQNNNVITQIEKPITAVAYKKGHNWMSNNYVLSRDVLVEDFGLMKDIGISTIKYEGISIYDTNVVNISREMDISLIFSFWIPETINFAEDDDMKRSLSNEILEKVKGLLGETHIRSWYIDNDLQEYQDKVYNEPVLTFQKMAYLKWLRQLIIDIKKIDSIRPVIANIELDFETFDKIDYMRALGVSPDIYGFNVSDSDFLETFYNDPRSAAIQYILQDVDANSFLEFKRSHRKASVILENWQDQWENNSVSFDGLIDFKGRKKASYNEMLQDVSNTITSKKESSIRILVPSILLYPKDEVTYSAVSLQDGKWIYPDPDTNDDLFEWILIKKDRYNNRLAIKDLGTGVVKKITIPSDYSKFELMLVYNNINESTVYTDITDLNTKIND